MADLSHSFYQRVWISLHMATRRRLYLMYCLPTVGLQMSLRINDTTEQSLKGCTIPPLLKYGWPVSQFLPESLDISAYGHQASSFIVGQTLFSHSSPPYVKSLPDIQLHVHVAKSNVPPFLHSFPPQSESIHMYTYTSCNRRSPFFSKLFNFYLPH